MKKVISLNAPDHPVDVEAAKLIQSALGRIMDKLGVKEGDEKETQWQMIVKDIQVCDVVCKDSPKATGLYVIQKGQAIAWVSSAYVNEGTQRMCVFIHDFDRDEGFELEGEKMGVLHGQIVRQAREEELKQ
jgi:hypothetical protein